MIYVEMDGRCGNQLFHYAVARYIQLLIDDKDLCLNFDKIFKKKDEENGWVDYLKDFNTSPYHYYEKTGTILKNESNIIQKALIAMKATQIIFNKDKTRQEKADKADFAQNLLNFFGVYWIREGVSKIYPRRRHKSLVSGICESNFIYEIQDVLQNEIVPKENILPKNKSLIKKIDNSNSVCISVRRGDFFTNKNQSSYGVCSPEYYIKAKKYFDEKKLNNTLYFCFSDDIEWCKKNLRFTDNNVIFVSQDMPVYETLRLMSSCKHFILSNSTFSWWGQFLSKYSDKIVVSPKRWNNDGYESQLIQKDWVLIDG
ncbi:alpha-1,2-fucosyltransferase [Limosilactobacillus reuteri]|uniref:alpha-1,2-fucosyltransferase n=1 Tax=Limosilactobacillus reuteri TaxID=1598 RepID=UPI000A2E3F06|nr:alpha-1,2-fucosyltransferase [Limosilactobacillus reuteri]OTA61685.1 glycosyl transferase [Limosilactobacillus reuteri]